MSNNNEKMGAYGKHPEDNYVPSRWTVSSNVELEASEVDSESGQVIDTPLRRRRIQADRMHEKKLEKQEARNIKIRQAEEKKKGTRIPRKWGILTLLAVAVVCVLILAAQYGHMVTTTQSIAEVRGKTEEVRKENAILEEKLAEATDEVTICTYAFQTLGMLPAKSVEAEEIVIEAGDP